MPGDDVLDTEDYQIEVGDSVAYIFNPHRQPSTFGGDAGLSLIPGRKLRTGCRGRMNDERLRVASVCQVAEKLDMVDEPGARLLPGLEAIKRRW